MYNATRIVSRFAIVCTTTDESGFQLEAKNDFVTGTQITYKMLFKLCIVNQSAFYYPCSTQCCSKVPRLSFTGPHLLLLKCILDLKNLFFVTFWPNVRCVYLCFWKLSWQEIIMFYIFLSYFYKYIQNQNSNSIEYNNNYSTRRINVVKWQRAIQKYYNHN